MNMRQAFCCIVLVAMAGCSSATRYDSGAVVLDISEPEAFNSRLETTPEFISAYDAMKAEDFTRAEALLDNALSRKPRDPYALLALGTVHERTGRYATAADLYKSAERYGHAAAGPKLVNTTESPENPALTVSDVARDNLAKLEVRAKTLPDS